MPMQMPPSVARSDAQRIVIRVTLFAVALVMVVWASVVMWHVSAGRGLEQLQTRAQADLRLASDRLVAAMLQYREVAVLAADHPYMRALAAEEGGIAPQAVAVTLQRMADLSGAAQLVLVQPDGRVLAGPETVPDQLPPTPDLARAAQGAMGAFHYVAIDGFERIFTYAAPVFVGATKREGAQDGAGGGRQIAGIVQLSFNAEQVEATGRGDPMPVWFTDAQGVGVIANRRELVFQRDPAAPPPDMRIYPPATPLFMGPRGTRKMAGHSLVCTPHCSLPIRAQLPSVGLTAHALADARPVLAQARQQALLTALSLIAAGAVLSAIWARRRALRERLQAEAEANTILEARVAQRTEQLQHTNAALLRTQAELVQAGKLSALGQMSAGISHELNQPLMAIGTYAENAAVFLARGRHDRAADNLTRIGEMSRRMGRIIRNLRQFARPEAEPAVAVDAQRVVDTALEISATRLDGVRVDWVAPAHPVWVMGGEVRLTQVLVNLIANAIDAMASRSERVLSVRVEAAHAPDRPYHRITVYDTGGGIADPTRIFDPFYSTKEVGQNEGMGLGLSISFRLVQSFGGALRGENTPDGARFTIDLRCAEPTPHDA
ncbi:sensor histidine kinase [Rhodobacteraceae bacterium]|nr:sensor histidine kinase [Paracoccaceae bacterium]